MPNLKYKCNHCDFSSVTQHFVGHLVKKHPTEAFDKTDIAIVSRGGTVNAVSAKVGLGESSSNYKIHCCLGCNKFYKDDGRLRIHLRDNKTTCNVKHIEKAREILALYTSNDDSDSSVPKNTIIYPDAGLKEELESLRKANATLTKEVAGLKSASDALDTIDDLESENEYLKTYKYKYQRLRYVLLALRTPDDRNPFLTHEDRKYLINALDSNDILRRHKDGEDDWYDDFFFDDYEYDDYEFPVQYEEEDEYPDE
jgi:FtsZ-binding cell division protein ZapB